MVPWTLELEIGGKGNRRWPSILERNLRGWLDFFGEIYKRESFSAKVRG